MINFTLLDSQFVYTVMGLGQFCIVASFLYMGLLALVKAFRFNKISW